MKKIFSLLAVFLMIAGIMFGNVSAQKKARLQKNSKSEKTVKKNNRRSSKRSNNTLVAKNVPVLTTTTPVTPVTPVQNNPVIQPVINTSPVVKTEDIQSGNVVVQVTSNGNAAVKIGMSPMGVTVIEFPANDPIYEIHRNELYDEFVSVSCRQREGQSGRCLDNPTDALVLRPGKNFRFTGDGAESTVITVQRVSGIVVSFIIVPVSSIAQNANYVVVTYPVNEIVQARLKAGLPVNLAPVQKQPVTADAAVVEGNVAAITPNQTGIVNASFTSENDGNQETSPDDLEAKTVAELQRVGNAGFSMKFTKPVHGLEISVAPNNLRLTGQVIDTIAIRNTLSVPIKLVPEMPELYVETIAKKGESINSVRVPILYRATTIDDSDVLQPGEIYYFSIAYEVPILGAKQTLKIAFAQTNAADEPVVLELSGIAR
jgi:hypothetical protein